MTGRLFVYPAGTAPGPHTRVIFHLDDGSLLFFDDCRKFGYVRALNLAELEAWDFWRQLGPEPWDIKEPGFISAFGSRGRAIKGLLLDQTLIAGIGNIYADESLFRAGISPDTPGNKVPQKHLRGLRKKILEVLEEAIEACGSSIRDYRTAQGDAGSFQNFFMVYGRGGRPCLTCGKTLLQKKVAGRTSVFCPSCQRD
jgi:formamidopyrimidine-DNA glycosylase